MIRSDASGTIVAISVGERRGIRKENVASAELRTGHGIEGDAHAGEPLRQVSLLAGESIAKMTAAGLDVGPGSFAENITTDGINLADLAVGDHLRLGGSVELEVTQLGKECHDRCAIFEQAGDCVMPREGVFARVTRGGSITVGDAIELT